MQPAERWNCPPFLLATQKGGGTHNASHHTCLQLRIWFNHSEPRTLLESVVASPWPPTAQSRTAMHWQHRTRPAHVDV
jgi:hypothetical protein